MNENDNATAREQKPANKFHFFVFESQFLFFICQISFQKSDKSGKLLKLAIIFFKIL
jgi:hypothetical protein